MAIDLVIEDGTGRANATAFASVDTVTQKLALSPYADAWTDVADADRQAQYVAEASAWLTRQPWLGVRTFEAQALAFPRSGLSTPDGYAVASNAIPAWLIDATARLAFWLSQRSATPFADSGLEPGSRMSLPGGFSFTVARGTPLPPDVRQLIRGYIGSSSTLVRG